MGPILIAVTFALVAGVFGWFGYVFIRNSYVNTDGYWINLIIGRHRVSLVENTKKYITDEQKAFVRKNIFNLKD